MWKWEGLERDGNKTDYNVPFETPKPNFIQLSSHCDLFDAEYFVLNSNYSFIFTRQLFDWFKKSKTKIFYS